jgi:hypothetical protein
VVVFCESRSFFRLPLKVGERCVSMVFSFLSVFFGQSSMHLPAGSLGLSWWGGGWGAPRRFLCTCVLCILVLNLEGWQILGVLRRSIRSIVHFWRHLGELDSEKSEVDTREKDANHE